MTIRILPMQIPDFWELIKFTVKQANEIDEESFQYFIIDLLHKLLNSEAHCFARVDEEGKVNGIAIAEIKIDKYSGKKQLLGHSMFAWEKVTQEDWIKDFQFMDKFARSQGCTCLITKSKNKRVWDLAESFGVSESYRNFIFKL